MKAPAKVTMLMIGALLIFAASAYGGITVSQVDGLNADGKIEDGATLTFHMNMQNPYSERIDAIDNGFWFFSDGMTWGSVDGAWNPAICWSSLQGCAAPYVFDMGAFMKIDGDTIGFGGINFFSGTGVYVGFNAVAYTIDIGPITLNNGTFLTMDSCFYDVNHWCWTISGPTGEVECTWGGPYTYPAATGGPGVVTTTLSQDPIELKDLADRVLEVYIHGEEISKVDLCSVRVHGKIPPYSSECATDDGVTITTTCFIFRFLSAYRPIPSTEYDTYIVTYLKEGVLQTVEGDVEIYVPGGDVNLDGVTNIDDLVFMVNYFHRGGPACMLEELMDIDQNGRVDNGDVSALAHMLH